MEFNNVLSFMYNIVRSVFNLISKKLNFPNGMNMMIFMLAIVSVSYGLKLLLGVFNSHVFEEIGTHVRTESNSYAKNNRSKQYRLKQTTENYDKLRDQIPKRAYRIYARNMNKIGKGRK